MQDFLSNPKNVRLSQQYLKVLIAYIQVLGSFVSFKVTWPEALGACIAGILNVTTFFKFEMLELPGLACIWHSYPYEVKTYVKLGTPIVGCFLLAIPVAGAWLARWRSRMVRRAKAYDAKKDVVNWSQRYEDTLDVFWVSMELLLSCQCHSHLPVLNQKLEGFANKFGQPGSMGKGAQSPTETPSHSFVTHETQSRPKPLYAKAAKTCSVFLHTKILMNTCRTTSCSSSSSSTRELRSQYSRTSSARKLQTRRTCRPPTTRRRARKSPSRSICRVCSG